MWPILMSHRPGWDGDASRAWIGPTSATFVQGRAPKLHDNGQAYYLRLLRMRRGACLTNNFVRVAREGLTECIHTKSKPAY